jgi:hypothetical protein
MTDKVNTGDVVVTQSKQLPARQIKPKKASSARLPEVTPSGIPIKDGKSLRGPVDVRAMRAEERKPVKGIFKFYDVPGGLMEFNYLKYKGDPIEKYSLVDGEVYTLPLGVARHLNKNGAYPVHSFTLAENGSVSSRIGRMVRRFAFQSLEFMELEDLMPNQAPQIEVIEQGFQF